MNTSFAFEEPVDLSPFDSLYRSQSPAEVPVHSDTIPDGRYEVVIAEASLTRSGAGNPMLRWLLRIAGATYRDRVIRKHSVISEKSLPFLRRELEICGLRLDTFSDLAHRVHELEGLELEVTKLTKGEFVNIYFNRAITAKSQPDGMADDDLPF